MLVSGLQTGGLFLAHCKIEPETIHAGIMVIREPEIMGQTVSLIQVENQAGDRYTVRVPAIAYNPEYNVVLERV